MLQLEQELNATTGAEYDLSQRGLQYKVQVKAVPVQF